MKRVDLNPLVCVIGVYEILYRHPLLFRLIKRVKIFKFRFHHFFNDDSVPLYSQLYDLRDVLTVYPQLDVGVCLKWILPFVNDDSRNGLLFYIAKDFADFLFNLLLTKIYRLFEPGSNKILLIGIDLDGGIWTSVDNH